MSLVENIPSTTLVGDLTWTSLLRDYKPDWCESQVICKTGLIEYRLNVIQAKRCFIGYYCRGEAQLCNGPKMVVVRAQEVHQLTGQS